jgi:hypothetical protein
VRQFDRSSDDELNPGGGLEALQSFQRYANICIPAFQKRERERERERENVYLEKELQMSHLLFSITNNQVLGRSYSDFRRCASVRACMLIHS